MNLPSHRGATSLPHHDSPARSLLLPFALLLAAGLGGCAESPDEQPATNDPAAASEEDPEERVEAEPAIADQGAEPEPAEKTPDPAPEPEGDEPAAAQGDRFAPGGDVSDADLAKYHVTMSCAVDGVDAGTMTFELWTEAAPITTRNFLRLVDTGFYDGIDFHRIARNFMLQGGDPTGTGTGKSPFGTIKAEFSKEPSRKHAYGVLSMARMGNDFDSAGAQFFLCCDESPSVWNLDGAYSSFGKLTTGVATLEKLASVPTTFNAMREKSKPLAKATIVDASVVEGAAPAGETIERPAEPLDLGGEPAKVVVQHVLLSFKGAPLPDVTRTKEEAEALATEILERVRAGESMDQLAREFSDDPVAEGDETPGTYTLLNTGVRDAASERAMFDLEAELREERTSMQEEVMAGKLSQEKFQEQMMAVMERLQKRAGEIGAMGRQQMVQGFGDVGFSLEVGEVGIAAYDAVKSPYGWHVIRRVE